MTGLKPGLHTLRVTVSYMKIVTRRHHRAAILVTKTVRVQFKAC